MESIDKVKVGFALLLVVAGVVGFYLLPGASTALHSLSPVVGVLAAAGVLSGRPRKKRGRLPALFSCLLVCCRCLCGWSIPALPGFSMIWCLVARPEAERSRF